MEESYYENFIEPYDRLGVEEVHHWRDPTECRQLFIWNKTKQKEMESREPWAVLLWFCNMDASNGCYSGRCVAL